MASSYYQLIALKTFQIAITHQNSYVSQQLPDSRFQILSSSYEYLEKQLLAANNSQSKANSFYLIAMAENSYLTATYMHCQVAIKNRSKWLLSTNSSLKLAKRYYPLAMEDNSCGKQLPPVNSSPQMENSYHPQVLEDINYLIAD